MKPEPRMLHKFPVDNESRPDYEYPYDPKFVNRTLEKFPTARRDVLTFISAVDGFSGETDAWFTSIEKLFSMGYCYYFAVMLKEAFGGTIVWHRGYAHVAWMDERGIIYDIYGVYGKFEDYDDNEFIPISEVDPDIIDSFMHNRLLTRGGE